MKSEKKVKPQKARTVEELTGLLKKYKIIGIVNLYKMPSSSIQKIKNLLRGKAVLRVAKRSLIDFAFKNAGLEKLSERLEGQPALILTEMSPFKLSFFLQKNKSSAPAKYGDFAENDIEVPAGPTSLMPGPAISTLTKAKIPAKVEGGKISIIKDCVVCKKGSKITADIAAALSLLKIEPMEIGLILTAIKEGETIYGKNVLSISEEQILNDLAQAHQHAVNLSVNTGYPTKETIGMILAKAYLNAKALADALKL